jgi:uncharacterized protein YecT (DUF1311 family)
MNSLKIQIIALSLLLGFSTSAIADFCEDASTTRDMVQCADQDYQAADKALNKAYKEKIKYLDEEGLKLLKSSQRAWIKFRDTECLLQRDAGRGGTIAPLLEISCLTSLTRNRTADLQVKDPMLDSSQESVIWSNDQNLNAPFTCEKDVEAKIGLVPIYNYEQARAMLYARLAIDTHEIDFPIGDNTQDSFCGTNLRISLSKTDSPCPAIRIDDDMCDAIYVYWNKEKQSFLWERN